MVILNKTEYIGKTESILNNKSKFQIIKGDCFKHVITLEDKLNRNLRKIKNKLSDATYNFLFASVLVLLKSIRQAVQLDLFYQPLIPLIII